MVIIVAGLLGAGCLPTSIASAGNGKCAAYDAHRMCKVYADIGVAEPGKQGDNRGYNNGDSGGRTTRCMDSHTRQVVPCSYLGSRFDPGRSCYMTKVEPWIYNQFPDIAAEAVLHPGNSLYMCQRILGIELGTPYLDSGDLIWLEDTEPRVDPEQVARRVTAVVEIAPINLGLSPRLEGGADGPAYVGVPVWLWADRPTPNTVGPLKVSNDDFGVLVTGEARLLEVVWTMGDGEVVHCRGENARGKVYQTSYGVIDSPACGYRYGRISRSESGGRYKVTATSHWEFAWSAGGMQGTIPVEVSNETMLPVGEIQVVVTGN